MVKRHLADYEIRAMRERAKAGESPDDLAGEFRLTPDYARKILQGFARADAGGPDPEIWRNGVDRLRLTPARALELRNRADAGEDVFALAREFGCSAKSAIKIKARRAFVGQIINLQRKGGENDG